MPSNDRQDSDQVWPWSPNPHTSEQSNQKPDSADETAQPIPYQPVHPTVTLSTSYLDAFDLRQSAKTAKHASDHPASIPNQSSQSDSHSPAHPPPEKLRFNVSTVHYVDESVASLHSKVDSPMDIMRYWMAQNAARPSPHRDPPPTDKTTFCDMAGNCQLPRSDREMPWNHEIKPENGRQSFAPFASTGQQQSTHPYNPTTLRLLARRDSHLRPGLHLHQLGKCREPDSQPVSHESHLVKLLTADVVEQ
ncbi:hypothetical protein CONLIGDRAFT_649034 [Coniochaeta ligniaria NRRL 30616]|uniref:Uncharacterized protein n=1 Tax=Coniochaeta ligniaria NRRL 30616 TaxID=1408157 RepID=A0A1J7IT60_9PEZI|nr:hypothetical protein CONLIGDRAFT_649034 [Coniochaeta ligniaria NRRL 30616]